MLKALLLNSRRGGRQKGFVVFWTSRCELVLCLKNGGVRALTACGRAGGAETWLSNRGCRRSCNHLKPDVGSSGTKGLT